MGEESILRCSHPLCHCPTYDSASRYCSSYCANVGIEEDDPQGAACACGHAACEFAHQEPHADDEIRIAMGGGPGAP